MLGDVKDPHVRALLYTMRVRPNVTYVDPPALDHDEPGFYAHLAAGDLRIDMKDHHASERSARAAVEPFLDAWEMDAALAAHRRDFRFEFARAEVIDRSPQPPGIVGVGSSVLGRLTMTATATVTSTRTAYPPPPRGFRVTDAVRQLWDRYEAAIDNREPATSAGYYCYTALMALAPPGTKKAQKLPWVARALSIDESVLKRIGELTNKGGPATARKFSPKPTPHTGAELNWLRMAVRLLTRRLGEWEFDRSAALPTITMSELPPL